MAQQTDPSIWMLCRQCNSTHPIDGDCVLTVVDTEGHEMRVLPWISADAVGWQTPHTTTSDGICPACGTPRLPGAYCPRCNLAQLIEHALIS